MRISLWTVAILFALGFCIKGRACIWDSKTLWEEKREHPTLAQAILSPKTEKPDIKELTDRIQTLRAAPNTNDPAWWNDLADAYLRMGLAAEAVKLLEPLTNKFAGDYGVHANLGTAYHLLGRYTDAEREIRRDTEINPDAHFGLEKYHLALLQYLSRDANYRLRHVYVDEFTGNFLSHGAYLKIPSKLESGNIREPLDKSERKTLEEDLARLNPLIRNEETDRKYREDLRSLAMADEVPLYQNKWNLAGDAKLDDGVIYMATLNPNEPACWVMLGMVAQTHRDLNLAKAAYRRAVELGSPQTDILNWHVAELNKFHPAYFGVPYQLQLPALAIALLIAFYIYSKWRDARLRRKMAE